MDFTTCSLIVLFCSSKVEQAKMDSACLNNAICGDCTGITWERRAISRLNE
jgi:hypothetical protein